MYADCLQIVWRILTKRLDVNNSKETPSHTMYDGVDYVPAKAPVLLGHHFASIAGAGPIVGPVIAAGFGWIPVYLWVVFGAIFIGGVHDYSSIVASVRHQSKSIGYIIQSYIGINGKKLFLIFAWATLNSCNSCFHNYSCRHFHTYSKCRYLVNTFYDTCSGFWNSYLPLKSKIMDCNNSRCSFIISIHSCRKFISDPA